MSQIAFHQLIAKGVEKFFTTPVEATEDYIRFFITADLFSADVLLTAFEPEPEYQAVKITFWLCDSEGTYLNFTHVPYDDLLFLCHQLSRSIEWGQITPLQFNENSSYINIYTCLDTDIQDVETMNRLDCKESRLLRGILRLCREVEMIHPAFYGVATSQIKDITHIDKFLFEEGKLFN